jgi:hypothetical protein
MWDRIEPLLPVRCCWPTEATTAKGLGKLQPRTRLRSARRLGLLATKQLHRIHVGLVTARPISTAGGWSRPANDRSFLQDEGRTAPVSSYVRLGAPMGSNLMQFYRTPRGLWRADGIPAPQTFTHNPACAGDRSVYVRRSDGHLGQYYFNPSGQWETFDTTESSGGWTITGSPAVQGNRSVYGRRDDGHLIQFYFDQNGNWSQHDITDLAGGGWTIIGDARGGRRAKRMGTTR